MEQYTLLESQLQALLVKAAEVGARRALIGLGKAEPTISWREACRVYGQGPMMAWRKAGLIKPIQQGMNATKKYSVTELVALSLSENRSQYLSASERREK